MITRQYTFLLALLLFIWILHYTGSLHVPGKEGIYSGEAGKKDDGKGVDGLGSGSVGSEDVLGGFKESLGMSGIGDASPNQGDDVGKEDPAEKNGEEMKEYSGDIGEKEEEVKNNDTSDQEKDNKGFKETESKSSHNLEISNSSNAHSFHSFCKAVTFQPGLYLQCHSDCGPDHTAICGGLNNARNRLQVCLRLALDLGSSIIIPTVKTQRNLQRLTDYVDTPACADLYWDIDFLEQELGAACPGLKVRRCGNVSGIDRERIVQMEWRAPLSAGFHKGEFKASVEEMLDSQALSLASSSAENPLLVRFGDSIYAYNYTHDSEQGLQKQLFRTLKYNPEFLKLGSQLRDAPELKDGYIGVHFRGESDWPLSFGSREEQIETFTREIEAASATGGAAEGIKTVYISCGDAEAIETLRTPLSELGYRVYDKWALVSSRPGLSSQLENMEFDTMAIIDYPVLVEASFFLGVWMSTFSQTAAYTRTMEDENDYWETYVTPGSRREGLARVWDRVPALKGDNTTKLMVVNTGDISNMDSYP